MQIHADTQTNAKQPRSHSINLCDLSVCFQENVFFFSAITPMVLGYCSVYNCFLLFCFFTHIWLHNWRATKEQISKPTCPQLISPFLAFGGFFFLLNAFDTDVDIMVFIMVWIILITVKNKENLSENQGKGTGEPGRICDRLLSGAKYV